MVAKPSLPMENFHWKVRGQDHATHLEFFHRVKYLRNGLSLYFRRWGIFSKLSAKLLSEMAWSLHVRELRRVKTFMQIGCTKSCPKLSGTWCKFYAGSLDPSESLECLKFCVQAAGHQHVLHFRRRAILSKLLVCCCPRYVFVLHVCECALR